MLFAMRAPRSLVVFVLAALGALSPRALAGEPKPADASRSVEIHAEHLDLDLEARSATMTGNVAITRKADPRSGSADTALELHCPRVDVRYDDARGQAKGELRVTWVKGTGGVVATVKGIHAEAPEVELDVANQTMALKGGVRVTRGEGWITADTATVHLTTGKVSMTEVKGSLPVGSASVEPRR